MCKTEIWLKSFGIVIRGQVELGAYSWDSIVCISFLANIIRQETVYAIISNTAITNDSYTPFFFMYIPSILIIIKVFSQLMYNWIVLKNNFKFALKLTLKSSYMFRCKTPSSGSTLTEPCQSYNC